jgi:hypothetical protein
MRRLLCLVPALLTAGCVTVAPRDHVDLHLSADIGVGSSRSESTIDGSSMSLSGTAATFGVGMGFAVRPNLILGGQVWGTSVPDPTVKDEYYGSGTATNYTYGLYGFGPMVKFYAMPINMYFSVTPSLTRMTLSDGDNNSAKSDMGFGLRAALGKEWSTAAGWSFGVGGVLDTSSNEATGTTGWKTVGAGIVFTASMN